MAVLGSNLGIKVDKKLMLNNLVLPHRSGLYTCTQIMQSKIGTSLQQKCLHIQQNDN
jgi:hypothetical protein